MRRWRGCGDGPLPIGGEAILDQFQLLARAADVDDIRLHPPPEEWEAQLEPLDGAQIGIAVIPRRQRGRGDGLFVAAMVVRLTG